MAVSMQFTSAAVSMYLIVFLPYIKCAIHSIAYSAAATSPTTAQTTSPPNAMSASNLIFNPKLVNGTTVCASGPPFALSQAGGVPTVPCVPSPVSCAFACQKHALNCTCFNYYVNGTCEFFSGLTVSVTRQKGCTLWTVCILNAG